MLGFEPKMQSGVLPVSYTHPTSIVSQGSLIMIFLPNQKSKIRVSLYRKEVFVKRDMYIICKQNCLSRRYFFQKIRVCVVVDYADMVSAWATQCYRVSVVIDYADTC